MVPQSLEAAAPSLGNNFSPKRLVQAAAIVGGEDRALKSPSRQRLLAAEIEAELEPGERLVWTGKPEAAAVHRKLRWLYWVAVPWVAMAIWFARDSIVAQFALLAGLALLLGPLVAAAMARRTIYALTDRRALILSKSIGHRSLTSVDLGAADETVEILRGEGAGGTVLFVSGLPPRRRYTDFTGKFGFWDVPDASEVAATVQEALDRRSGRQNRYREV
jgi:hypothetical protein